MQLDKLKNLYDECRYLPNYQYRDLSDTDLVKKAGISFKRLPLKQQEMVYESWSAKVGKTTSELLSSQEDVEILLKYRFMAQTNLYFLCHLLERYNQTTVFTHEEICNKFFVQKDPTYPSFEAFATQYTDLKERLLLVPRGGFKSSIDVADCVQWTICFPTVTILILTGVYRLAGDFVGEAKQHFTKDQTTKDDGKGKAAFGPRQLMDRETGEWSDSMFQVLFPEHCVTPTEGSQLEFQTPAGGDDKEPTIRAASIEQALSGMHFCLDPETWVYTEGGVKQVKNFKIGDKVLTHKGRYRRITALKERTAKKVKITFKKLYGFPVTCSIDHPFLTDSGEWKDAGELRKGDAVVRPYVKESPMSPVPMCEDVYNMLGWFVAEGSINKNQVQFAGHIDETEIFSKLGDLFVKYGADSYRIKQVSDKGVVLYIRRAPSLFTDVFREMYAGPFRKNIPSWVVNAPLELALAFARGLWQGDGDKRGSLTTVSREIAAGALLLKQQLGMEQSCTLIANTNRTLRIWGNIGEYEGNTTIPRSGCACSTVDKVEDVAEGPVVSMQVDEDETICVVGAITHNCVLKLDDVVTNENSTTVTRIETVNKQISINKAMLNPFGFYDVIGTWYNEQDEYGRIIAQEEKFAKEEGLLESIHGSVDSGILDSSVFVRVHLRACWWPTEEAKKLGKIEEELTKNDWVLWFPERLNYEFLSKEFKKDDGAGNFAIKYLNNPRKINNVKFPRELLIRRTIPHSQFPPQGIVVTTVDTAYSTKSWADYTVIMTALIFGGRFYIINMVRGRFNEYDLPKVIANVGYKWKPRRIAIEDSVGVKWMGRELRREMDKLKISIPVEFCSLGLGSKATSKKMKAKPVLRLLGDERMYFLNSCEGLNDIYEEMGKFTGAGDDRHDDIVSAVSLLVEQFGGYADMDAKVNSVNMDYVAAMQSQDLHNRIYCLGKYAKLNEAGSSDDNPTTQYQVNNTPIPQVAEHYIDPLSDLMG